MGLEETNGQARVGVGVFVFRSKLDRRFLLGIRKGSIGAGTFSLAGGHLEHFETFEQCAIREVKEETDLDLEGLEFLTAVENFFPEEDGGRHYVTILMTGFVTGEGHEPKLMEPEKCEGWHWHSFQEMRDLDQSEGEKLFLPLRNLLVQRPDVCALLER